MRSHFVYITASHSNDPVLYIGVTNDLERRLSEHRSKLIDSFTKEYNCDKLVYFEMTESIESAISREKQLKRWHRQWKLNLIAQNNPQFHDLLRQSRQETLKQVQGDKIGLQ